MTIKLPLSIMRIEGNMGWHEYYVKQYNKTLVNDCAILAMLYLFRALRDGEAV